MHEANINSPAAAQGGQGPELPGGIHAGPALAAVLYGLLVGSAALSLLAQRLPGSLPLWLVPAAPWVFLAFAACFAVYRWALVRAGKYSASKAFFQVGAALFFFILLLVPRARPADEPGDAVSALMQDADPRVRALAAEVAGYRPDGSRYARDLVRALGDPDEAVRRQAHASLVRWAGVDLGAPSNPDAVQAWRQRFP
jgi:hypothetical protein